MLTDSELQLPLPDVSFVVLCYKFERYIGDCIQSILDLTTDASYEIIVVDDASPDGSLAVIKSFSDPRIRLVEHPVNAGHAKSVTDGIAACRGRFVARIDGDDRYRPQFLAETLPVFEKFPGVGLVYGDARLVGGDGEVFAEKCDRAHGGQAFVGNELLRLLAWNFVCAPTVIARTEFYKSALPAPSHLAFHDWYFTLSVARQSEFAFLPVSLADYRIHPGNLHSVVSRDGTEEISVIWMLDSVFQAAESSPELEAAKRRMRRRIYAAHYLDFAEKYFGHGRLLEARRCYREALLLAPTTLLKHPASFRRWAATYISRPLYERVKSVFKRVMSGVGRIRD